MKQDIDNKNFGIKIDSKTEIFANSSKLGKNNIFFRAKWISDRLFAGNFLSKLTGESLAFKELREYNIDDDYKSIDWLASAKMNKPYVKVNEAERNNDIIFLFDISNSIDTKRVLMAEISNIIAYSSIKNNDKVGAVFFSDKVKRVVPLNQSRNITSIITNILLRQTPVPCHGTSINECLRYVINAFPKNSVVIVFSDFYTNENFEKCLSIASKKFKMLAVKIADAENEMFIDSGFVKIFNSETNSIKVVKLTPKMKNEIINSNFQINQMLKKYVKYFVEIKNLEDYIKQLSLFY